MKSPQKGNFKTIENASQVIRLPQHVQELEAWIKQFEKTAKVAESDQKSHIALLYGAKKANPLATAILLAQKAGKEVHRVDLSVLVSKYPGETEKNIQHLFERAETEGCILFFDEADAIFGKRTNVRDAHDRYANIEVSYLKQKIEAYEGLIILYTNRKSNVDHAFLRRIQSVIRFPAT